MTRVGDNRTRDLDIRVIAAATSSLEKEVAAGRLREDLFLYLNVFPITCLPLRDHPEDIPELASHLLTLACKRLGRPKPVITERVMTRLAAYGWPGNVRELRNVIERAAIVSKGGKLIVELGEGHSLAASDQSAILTEAEMQQAVRRNILACLRETGGKVAGPDGAAAVMGVQPTTLYSRLRKFNIAPEEWKAP